MYSRFTLSSGYYHKSKIHKKMSTQAWLPSLDGGYYGTFGSNLDVPLSGFGTAFVSDARVCIMCILVCIFLWVNNLCCIKIKIFLFFFENIFMLYLYVKAIFACPYVTKHVRDLFVFFSVHRLVVQVVN